MYSRLTRYYLTPDAYSEKIISPTPYGGSFYFTRGQPNYLRSAGQANFRLSLPERDFNLSN